MSASAQLRTQIENSLSARIPYALTPQTRRERPVHPTGIAAVDNLLAGDLLAGGLPLGAITEIVGAASSGRTSCALAFVASLMRTGQVCAWVDASDSFDPVSAAANGVDLDRLLWVRCGCGEPGSTANPVLPAAAAPSKPVADPLPGAGSPHPGSNPSIHPRSEARGLHEAVHAFLHKAPHLDAVIGTPGAPNRAVLPQPTSRQEQVSYDRLPARRGAVIVRHRVVSLQQRSAELAPRCAEPQPRRAPAKIDLPAIPSLALHPDTNPGNRPVRPSHWQRLDRALRATDLLMQAGGFGAVVLDLGDIPAEAANRVPLATWFRYRAAADRTRAAFLLLTRHPCAQSSAEILLRTSASLPEAGTVMGAIPFKVELVRQRFQTNPDRFSAKKKPPQSAAAWSAQPDWASRNPG